MTKFRYAVIAKDTAKGTTVTSGTETVDLPESDILSEVIIQARSLGAYSDDMIVPMHIIIKKVELLVNGSTVVKSLSGTQIRALGWYNGGPFGTDDPNQSAQNENFRYSAFTLYLGRFAGDTKCGLDLGMYANPQLKIEWDASTTSWDGLTFDAHTSPTFTYSVICKMFDGTPAGFMNKYVMSKQIDSWTTTAGAEHPTEIPRGYDLWGLMWRGAYYNIQPYHTLDSLKLDFDNGKWVPIDMNYGQLWQVFKSWFPKPCESMRYISMTHADTFDLRMLWPIHFNASELGANGVSINITTGLRNMSSISIMETDGTVYGTAISAFVQVIGFGPHQTIYIPMKHLVDGETGVVPTTNYSRIDIKTTPSSSSGSSGTQYMIAEYLKPNGE